MNTEVEDVKEEEQEQQLDLNIEVDETSACGRHVTVTVPRAEVERYFAKQFDDLVPKAEIPGFRPGRAPRALVEKKFRKQLTDQVKGQLIMDSLAQVNESQEFSAISEPDLDYEQVKIPEEGDFTYEFNIEVRPEFEVPEYKGLKLERPEHDFTDEEIDSHITRLGLNSKSAALVPVEEPAQEGDFVICKISTKFEDNVVSVNDEVSLKVVESVDFADSVIAEFDKLVVGAVADDVRTATVEISQFADNEELRGKEVELEIEVLDVKRVDSKSTDELAESFGMDSAEALREVISNSLVSQLEYEQRQVIRDQISDKLTESADWNLPEDLLERQASRELQRVAMEMQASGFSESEIVARENELRKDIHEKTAKLLKEHFILERVAELEEIEDEPMDYEIEIAKIAAQRGDSPRRVRTQMERSGQMDALRNMILERKVIDLITENATFTATEYNGLPEEEKSFSTDTYLGGKKQSIPEAKYDGGEAPAIPGTEKDK